MHYKKSKLKSLTDSSGVSGMESEIVKAIVSEMDPTFHKIEIDRIGNLIITNPGKKPKRQIVIDAHTDEVGVQISKIEADGTLKFFPVGGIDEFTLLGKTVLIGSKKTPGVFCANSEIKNQPISYRDMYICIGSTSYNESIALCAVGDSGTFESDYVEFGDGFVKARNLDDRVGCAIIVELLKEKLDVHFIACFSVKEELGLYGAMAVVPKLHPELAICLEGAGCADIPHTDEDRRVCILGSGPALSVRNQYSIFNVEANRYVSNFAKKHNIPCQFRRGNAGGCNSKIMQQTPAGAISVTLAPPTRYIHTHNSVSSIDDYNHTRDLVRALICEISETGGFDGI